MKFVLAIFTVIGISCCHSLRLGDILSGRFNFKDKLTLDPVTEEKRNVVRLLQQPPNESFLSSTTTESSKYILEHPYFKDSHKHKEHLLSSLFEIASNHSRDDTNVKTVKKSGHPTTESDQNDILSLFHSMSFLPVVKDNSSHHVSHEGKPLLQLLDTIRHQAWKEFQNSLTNSVDSIGGSEDSKLSSSPLFQLIMKYLSKGEDMNIFHLLGKKIDPELFDFQNTKELEKLFLQPQNQNVTSTINSMASDVAWTTVRKIGNQLLKKIKDTVPEENFEKYARTLKNMNPLAFKGLGFLTKLLKDDKQPTGRSLMSKRRLGNRRDYGHGGHGSTSGGHYHGIYIDPYLILAGLGAAALLGLLAYQVFLDQQNARASRTFSIERLSTKSVANVIGLIEKASKLYDTLET